MLKDQSPIPPTMVLLSLAVFGPNAQSLFLRARLLRNISSAANVLFTFVADKEAFDFNLSSVEGIGLNFERLPEDQVKENWGAFDIVWALDKDFPSDKKNIRNLDAGMFIKALSIALTHHEDPVNFLSRLKV